MKKPALTAVALSIALTALPALAAESESATLYKSKCAMCHAADGSGNTATGKAMRIRDLRADEVQKRTDVELTKIIAGGEGKMPAYGKQFSTEQIQGLIAFICTLKP